MTIAGELGDTSVLAIRRRIANHIARRVLRVLRAGDRPRAQTGPVDVLGSDPHGLGRDNDRVACE